MAGLVPAKISDRYAKNGEDMLDVLSHDIMRYEMLAEKETFDALTSVLQGEQSHDNVELHEIEVNRLNNDNNNNDEGDPTETHEQRDTGSSRFRSVSNEDTDEFLRKNVNKNTDYKTRSDVKTFYTWAQQVGEFRELQMIPFKELDAILARFYLDKDTSDCPEYDIHIVSSQEKTLDIHYDKENDSELSMFEKPSQASSIVNNSKSNMIANRKDCSNPFSILTGAVINGGVINLNIFSGKRKRDDFSSSQES
ncbi:unnamed protein product [Mytilus edulis]|uniref:Uncharacterized protein n=1 Tax=Mytilus edulis TaxID=6550 RepID=A0A8S3UB88_MYTED|nr:unnamed protein product [Mytilus edulis]